MIQQPESLAVKVVLYFEHKQPIRIRYSFNV